jgi:hypothetical protein
MPVFLFYDQLFSHSIPHFLRKCVAAAALSMHDSRSVFALHAIFSPFHRKPIEAVFACA